MKLRNKRTGEIIDLEQWRLEYYKDSGCITITNDKNQNEQFCYGVFADLKDDWQDYIDPYPLIKDEKIRKVVRVWAEFCGIDKCHFEHNEGEFTSRWYGISLPTSKYGEDIKSGVYTIAELCGEGEE